MGMPIYMKPGGYLVFHYYFKDDMDVEKFNYMILVKDAKWPSFTKAQVEEAANIFSQAFIQDHGEREPIIFLVSQKWIKENEIRV